MGSFLLIGFPKTSRSTLTHRELLPSLEIAKQLVAYLYAQSRSSNNIFVRLLLPEESENCGNAYQIG